MKKLIIPFLFAFVLSLQSCEIVGDIFKFGLYTGIIIIVLLVALVVYIISRFRR